MKRSISRRETLRGLMLGTAGGGIVSTMPAGEVARADTTPAAQAQGVCTLFPQAVEGPYYFDPKLVRPNITEDRPGVATELFLKVFESGSCAPIANARVDIWHADAGGVYSGYARQGDNRDISTERATYLRGTQFTDKDGNVNFRTIYPGWYPGRTPHIHVKVFLDKLTLVTGQIYFEDALSSRIYRDNEPYKERPTPDTSNGSDFIFKSSEREGGSIVFVVKEEPDRLIASLMIAVDRTGAAAKRAEGWGGFLRNIMGR